jgi:hypothetical protein
MHFEEMSKQRFVMEWHHDPGPTALMQSPGLVHEGPPRVQSSLGGGGLHHSVATAFTCAHSDGSGLLIGGFRQLSMHVGSPLQFVTHCCGSKFGGRPMHFFAAASLGHE